MNLTIEAPDPHAAAQKAADIADRLCARVAVGTSHTLRFDQAVYIAGHPRPLGAKRTRRADVHALERENRLLALNDSESIDQALELLSHLNTGPAPVAAAAGWASVESLLSGPGDADKVVTAERLANLVACSWPRAELTTIAWRRINQMEASKDALLRRLYRQRNLVVHGGLTAGFGLASALRTAAPLVGAGIDRVAHATLTGEIRPLEIAARAHVEINRAGTSDAPPLTRLLE